MKCIWRIVSLSVSFYLIEYRLCRHTETKLLKLCSIEIGKISSSMEWDWGSWSLGNWVILGEENIVVSTLSSEKVDLVYHCCFLVMKCKFWILFKIFTTDDLLFEKEILHTVNILMGSLSCYLLSLSIHLHTQHLRLLNFSTLW